MGQLFSNCCARDDEMDYQQFQDNQISRTNTIPDNYYDSGLSIQQVESSKQKEIENPRDSDQLIIPLDNKININNFKLIKILGKGAFGKVVLVQLKKTSQLFAMKIIKKEKVDEENSKRYTMNERSILQNINHPFAIKLYYAFQSKQKLYLVMDFAQGGELYFHLRRAFKFDENTTRFFASELLSVLDALHKRGIIYRDLKPENVLIDKDGHIKLADFGLCKVSTYAGQVTHSIVGTPEYLAPEVYIDNQHTQTCDWWSLGALIYEMLAGATPFFSVDKTMMFRNRAEKPIEMKSWFSEGAVILLKGLLNNDKPIQRLGANGSDEIKQSLFFKEIDWEALDRREIPSPLQLTLKHPRDCCYFQNCTDENATDSPTEGDIQFDDFQGFSYDEESNIII